MIYVLIRGLVIPYDASKKVSRVEFDNEDIKTMQRYVGGLFDVTDLDEMSASLWYHDEGKLIGLPINYRATFMLFVYRPEFAQVGDPIVGDVLVTGVPDDEGDTQSVPDELVKLLFETRRYHVTWRLIGEKTLNQQTVTFTNWASAFEYAYLFARSHPKAELVRVVPA